MLGMLSPQRWLKLGPSHGTQRSTLVLQRATKRTTPSKDTSSAPLRQSSTSPSQSNSLTSLSVQPMTFGESSSDHETSLGITNRLYISHFLSAWNFRGFEFGAVLFLATIFPGTLLPMSVYALARATCAIIFAPTVGQYIDNNNRWRVIRNSIIWQRIAVILSCILFWSMLVLKASLPAWCRILLLGVNIFLACTEKLCSIMNTVSIERDWVTVIADDKESSLRKMNSQMRRIDLFCKLVSPLVIGLLDGFSTQLAIAVTFGINTTSVFLEYVLIARVYKAVPALADRRPSAIMENDIATNTEQISSRFRSIAQHVTLLVGNLRIYASQDAFLPSLSLSILYLTVLSFAGQMVTYLLAAGYTVTFVSLIRIASAVCEISATWLAPYVISRIGPIRSGIWFLSFQMICLGAAVVIFWTAKTTIWAASGLLGGTALSRVGLWGFDLSAQIIIQDEVELQYRGRFSTTEAALQNFFELCAYTSTIIFFRPLDFKYPAMISIVAVYIAAIFYASFVRQRRGHLFHVSKCIEHKSTSISFYRQIREMPR